MRKRAITFTYIITREMISSKVQSGTMSVNGQMRHYSLMVDWWWLTLGYQDIRFAGMYLSNDSHETRLLVNPSPLQPRSRFLWLVFLQIILVEMGHLLI